MFGLLGLLLDGYTLVVLATVIVSWLSLPEDHPVVRLTSALTKPLLTPIRRVLPSFAGLDFSPMVLLIGLRLLRRVLLG
ncbi:MAG TPA: YggT family protein [Polyangiaceae bacterium]|jgi:YggT family protein